MWPQTESPVPPPPPPPPPTHTHTLSESYAYWLLYLLSFGLRCFFPFASRAWLLIRVFAFFFRAKLGPWIVFKNSSSPHPHKTQMVALVYYICFGNLDKINFCLLLWYRKHSTSICIATVISISLVKTFFAWRFTLIGIDNILSGTICLFCFCALFSKLYTRTHAHTHK